MKDNFDITGMTCSACALHVEKAVSKLDGILQVNVNLLQNSMQVEYDENRLTRNEIEISVQKAGYGAQIHLNNRRNATSSEKKSSMKEISNGEKKRLILSILFLIPLMMLTMGHMVSLKLPSFLAGTQNAFAFAFTQLLLVLPVMYFNRTIYEKGFQTLFHGAPNMDTLIAIGSGAAFVYGIVAIYVIGYGTSVQNMELVSAYRGNLYFESVSMILTLISLGKYLEERSKKKTTDAVKRMTELLPDTALVERDGVEIEIPVEELQKGECFLVKAGGKVPADGIVIEGYASFDESSLTGESIPVEKQKGNKINGSTICKSGYVRVEAQQVGEDTAFSRIIQLISEAASSKAPIARLADRVAGVFVPIVLSIAILTVCVWLVLGYGISFALTCGISVLVISCPCALGLATPTAIMVGTGKAAENGVLIKSAESLEMAKHIDTMVLDKTGTITEGKPVVCDVIIQESMKSEAEFLQIAGSLEKASEHPLAEAIVSYIEEQKIEIISVQDFRAVPGQGIIGRIQGSSLEYVLGNEKMMQEYGISLKNQKEKMQKLSESGKTVLYLAVEKKLLGCIAVFDKVKEGSREAVKELQKMGIEVYLLTGDHQKTAEAVAADLGISKVKAEVLPEDKEKIVRELCEQGKKTAMAGDGVNDAPALMRADIGIAIGAGTDIAVDAADIILVSNDLRDSVYAIGLSRAVIRNVKQNLFWAFFYNALGIPLAAGVFYPVLGWTLSPMFGALAMSFSSVFVVSNALRLKNYKNRIEKNEESKKRKEDRSMKVEKILKVEGMMCAHCKAHVEEALNQIPGVQAIADVEKKNVYLTLTENVEDIKLIEAVEKAGYHVIE